MNWAEHFKKLSQRAKAKIHGESTVSASSGGHSTGTVAVLVLGGIAVGTFYGEKILKKLGA